MVPEIHVAVAVIVGPDGRVLVDRRPTGAAMGGSWEFPGGKVEPGESALDALIRELDEELAIVPRDARPLIRYAYDYKDIRVLLDAWRVPAWDGDPVSPNGDEVKWVTPQELASLDLLDADRPLVNAVRLPTRYAITGPRAHVLGIEQLIDTGHKLIQLRAPDLDENEFKAVAVEAVAACRLRGATLLLNAEVELVRELDADGVHLDSRQLHAFDRRPLSPEKWIGASCHDTAELTRAREIGCNFAVLGPVRATNSHVNVEALGWERFALLADGAGLPVYALGGVGDIDLMNAWNSHGQGVAGISAWWPREVTQLP